MKVTRISMFSGKETTMDLPVTQEQLDDYYIRGALLQYAFPQLNADQREFIKTGVAPGEWEEFLGPER